MVQNYIQYQNQSNQLQTIKPNIKKIFLKNLFSTASVLLLITAIFLIINWSVGLYIFLVPLETFGISLNPSALLLYFVLIIIGTCIFLLLGNYLVIVNLRYEFYQDRLVVYKGKFLVSIKPEEVPYQNIVRISYNSDGIFNTIFNSGIIVLELTGMKDNKVELEFIDDVEQTSQYIQNIIRDFMSIQQAQFTENYKMGNILKRL